MIQCRAILKQKPRLYLMAWTKLDSFLTVMLSKIRYCFAALTLREDMKSVHVLINLIIATFIIMHVRCSFSEDKDYLLKKSCWEVSNLTEIWSTMYNEVVVFVILQTALNTDDTLWTSLRTPCEKAKRKSQRIRVNTFNW